MEASLIKMNENLAALKRHL